ncbi:MAG TPA: DMT family transporter [Thermotogota bacterium]|nr:DMT family transporter [Thermotogota bacterium]
MTLTLVVSLTVLSLVWSSYYTSAGMVAGSISPFLLGILIRLVTLVFFSIVFGVQRKLKRLLAVRGVLGGLILVGLLGFSLDITAFLGLRFSSATDGSILLKMDLIFANILTSLIWRKHLGWQNWSFTGVALVGVFCVLGISPANLEPGSWGNLFFILSAFFIALNAFVIQRLQHHRSNPVPDGVIAFYNNAVTLLFFSATWVLFDRGSGGPVSGWQPGIVVPVLVAGICQSLLYLLYYYNLRRLPVWVVKLFLLQIPVFTALFEWGLSGSAPTRLQWLGMGLILSSSAGILLSGKKKGFVGNVSGR